MSIIQQPFGHTASGEAVDLFTLSNGELTVSITNYGGRIVRILAPDRRGIPGDVTWGFDSLPPYLGENPAIGSTIGRVAGRIANACFTLNGVEYHTSKNNLGRHTIHGGFRRYDRVTWQARPFETDGAPSLELSYLSPDGEDGFPGNLQVKVTFSLNASALKLDFDAVPDADTPVSLTNHAYFNLNGDGASIYDHELQLSANAFCGADAILLPTGELVPLQGTVLDFNTPANLGERLKSSDALIRLADGINFNYALSNFNAEEQGNPNPPHAATLYHPASGRRMEMFTTAPGIQVYTATALDGSLVGHGGKPFCKHGAVALEAQHFPNAVNFPQFPSPFVKAGEHYRQVTVFAFSAG